MDRRERGNDQAEAIKVMIEGQQSQIWTALPGIIQSFDPVKQTCVVQIALKFQAQTEDGTFIPMPPNRGRMAPLVDCPVYFPHGGGFSLTFPLAEGDECLVVFAARCIDAWWQSGGLQEQAEDRMHDLSDGFVFAGMRAVPNVVPGVSTSSVQLRSDDQNTLIELDPDGNVGVVAAGNVVVTAQGNVGINAANAVTLSASTVNINGTLIINGVAYLAHHHSGVTSGGSNTGGVSP